jgi:hypothetical protein
VIVDCPEDEPVPGLGDGILVWNQMGNEDEWYNSVFEFSRLYLQDDDAMILIMPIATTMELVPHMRKFGMKVEYDFLYDQPHPLTHSHYENKLVSFGAFSSLYWEFSGYPKVFDVSLHPSLYTDHQLFRSSSCEVRECGGC